MGLRLDSFGNHRKIQRPRHGKDTAQHCQVAIIVRDAVDHRAIQFECMQRQQLEIAKVAEARAEIVQCDPNAPICKSAQPPGRTLEIGDQRLLGNFQRQARWRETRLAGQSQQVVAKGPIEQVHGRDVEGQAQAIVPASGVFHRRARDLPRKAARHPARLGNGDHRIAGHLPMVRVVPPQQGLRPYHHIIVGAELGLEQDLHITQRASEIFGNRMGFAATPVCGAATVMQVKRQRHCHALRHSRHRVCAQERLVANRDAAPYVARSDPGEVFVSADRPIYEKLALVHSDTERARRAAHELGERHEFVKVDEADAVIALGGDGTMLDTLHDMLDGGRIVPVFGLNLGTVGFLMNRYHGATGLAQRLMDAKPMSVLPLRMDVITQTGENHRFCAINEVSLLRETRQTAKVEISVNGRVRIPELAGDGVLLSTPVGSTAYNLSANGPILPLDSSMLALTPISPFRPRRWRGAILPDRSRVSFRVNEPAKRPVAAVADSKEVRDVAEVHVAVAREMEMTLLFDPHQALDERIVAEQFVT